MRITPTAPTLTIPAIDLARMDTLRAGQLLEVQVVQRLDDSRFLLQSGTHRWQAESRQTLTPGEQVLAQVLAKEPGQPAQLAILASRQQSLAAAIREQLPRQQALTGLARLLSHLPALTLPAETRQRLTALLAALPDAASLQQPEGLRQQLARSGLFLESGLLGGHPPAPDDLKARLLQLAATLPQPRHEQEGRRQQPAPLPLGGLQAQARLDDDSMPDDPASWLQGLADSVDGALSRLTGHQLQHAQDQHAGQQQWLLELPVRDRDGIDVLQLHIRRDRPARPRREDHDESLWQLTLSFDFSTTGPMMVRLTQQAETLNIRIHAESQHAWQWVDEQLPALRATLVERGLAGVQLEVCRGLPHQDTLAVSHAPLLRAQA